MNKKQFKNKQMLRKEQQLKELKENGLTFPIHNPLPKRKEDMGKNQIRILKEIKGKEKNRQQSKSPNTFKAWENMDRYSYRKEE